MANSGIIFKASLNDKLASLGSFNSKEINPFTDGIIESILIEKNPLKMFYIPSTGDHHFSTGDIQLPLNLLNHLREQETSLRV